MSNCIWYSDLLVPFYIVFRVDMVYGLAYGILPFYIVRGLVYFSFVSFLYCEIGLVFMRFFLTYGCIFVGHSRKLEEQKPKEHRPKASENKPVMNE